MTVKRGDIFYADLSPVVGSEQGGVRPVLIIQNDCGNRHSPTVIVAAINNAAGKAAGIYPKGTFIGLGFDAQGFQHGHNGGYPVRFFQPKPLDIAEQATGFGSRCHR